MIKNYFKTAWRNLINNKAHSFINIAGLSIGLTCSLFIFLWVQNELSIDAFHKNNSRLYKLYEREYYKDHVDGNYDMPAPLAQELKSKIPEIQDAVMIQVENNNIALQAGDKVLKTEGTAASAGLFTMFSYPLLQGSAEKALSSPNNIVISKKTADVFFGSPQNAMGKIMRFDDKQNFIVSAVFKDLPQNVSRRFDYVIPWEAWQANHPWGKEWQNSGPLAFVLLSAKADPVLVDKKITHFLDAYKKDQSDAYRIQLGLQKFDEVYLHNHFENGYISGGRIEYVHLFGIIAIFILLIACINFMNLTTARSVKRAKEVGVRKCIGANRSGLIKQFIGESLLLTASAVLIALLLLIIVIPFFNYVMHKQIQLPFYQLSFWSNIVIITIVTGVVAGSYPALYLSSFNPVKVLKGTIKLSSGAVWFRKGLVIFQFVLSLILIIGTFVVSKQVNFIQNKNIGYNRDNLLYIPVEGELAKKYALFKQEALNINGVKNISCISENPTSLDSETNGVDWDGRNPATMISFQRQTVGYDFVETMKLTMIYGHHFSKDFAADNNGFMLNETAIKNIGYKNPIGKFITVNGKRAAIIGVLQDFNYKSLQVKIQPLILSLNVEKGYGYILLRTQAGQTRQAIAGVEKLWRQLNPAFPFSYSFSDDEYQRLYENEKMIGKLSNAFASIAIFISCLGLLGLIMFTAEQRSKEIGIRKVLGASISSILRLLSADFLQLIFIAILIASPIAWWAMNSWLGNYAYKITIGWWMFAAAGGVVILIALATVSFQAVKAALANPVKSLRSE